MYVVFLTSLVDLNLELWILKNLGVMKFLYGPLQVMFFYKNSIVSASHFNSNKPIPKIRDFFLIYDF